MGSCGGIWWPVFQPFLSEPARSTRQPLFQSLTAPHHRPRPQGNGSQHAKVSKRQMGQTFRVKRLRPACSALAASRCSSAVSRMDDNMWPMMKVVKEIAPR